ncbi:hypothetical protein Dimus_026838, partial [Dionaea muscipula]
AKRCCTSTDQEAANVHAWSFQSPSPHASPRLDSWLTICSIVLHVRKMIKSAYRTGRCPSTSTPQLGKSPFDS